MQKMDMVRRFHVQMKRTNNSIARVAGRQEEVDETKRFYISLQFVDKDSGRQKQLVNHLFAET